MNLNTKPYAVLESVPDALLMVDRQGLIRFANQHAERLFGYAPDKLIGAKIQVGRDHNVTPGHIVGAIANEAGLDGGNIGRIQMYDKTTTVDLPRGMPPHILQHLKKVRIFQQPLAIELDAGQEPSDRSRPAGGKPAGPTKKKEHGKRKPKR